MIWVLKGFIYIIDPKFWVLSCEKALAKFYEFLFAGLIPLVLENLILITCD